MRSVKRRKAKASPEQATPEQASPLKGVIKLKRTLSTILENQDRASVCGDLETFLESSTWNVIKAILTEEIFTHESKMRSLLRYHHYHTESVYELGTTEAFEYIRDSMIRKFIDEVRSGKAVGLVEDPRPSDNGAEVSFGSMPS